MEIILDRKTALIRFAIAVVVISILVITKSVTPLYGGIIIAVVIIASAIRTRGFRNNKEE